MLDVNRAIASTTAGARAISTTPGGGAGEAAQAQTAQRDATTSLRQAHEQEAAAVVAIDKSNASIAANIFITVSLSR